MSLVQVEQLQKSFGGDTLFAPFSAQIGPGDRVALIGDNGVGKSTLLRLLSGDETPSAGVVRLIGGARVGYFPQAARLEGTGTLFEAMEAAFAPLQDAERELRELETVSPRAQRTRTCTATTISCIGSRPAEDTRSRRPFAPPCLESGSPSRSSPSP